MNSSLGEVLHTAKKLIENTTLCPVGVLHRTLHVQYDCKFGKRPTVVLGEAFHVGKNPCSGTALVGVHKYRR